MGKDKSMVIVLLIFSTLVIVARFAASSQSVSGVDQHQERFPYAKDNGVKWRDQHVDFDASFQIGNLRRNSTTITSRELYKNQTFPDKTPTPEEEPPPPPEYQEALLKGTCILKSVYKIGDTIGTWLNFWQIAAGGWEQQIPVIHPVALGNIPNTVTDPPWDPNKFREFTFDYDQDWLPEPSTATYSLFANPESGVVIVEMAYAPLPPYEDPDPDPDADTPPPTGPLLTRLSDITFLVWKQVCLEDDDPLKPKDLDECMHGLKWIIHDYVSEPRTLAVIDYAMKIAKAQLDRWPRGTTFQVKDEPGTALVGTPNGWGIAYMIGQYPIYLGPLTIDYATVFLNDRDRTEIAFHIDMLDESVGWPG